jgi:hypothetical protein
MKHNYKFILGGFILVIAASSIFFLAKDKKKNIDENISEIMAGNGSNKNELTAGYKDSVTVQTDDGEFKKINIVNNIVGSTSALERRDFSNFSGLPKLGIKDDMDTAQAGVLIADDKSKAIVIISIEPVSLDNSQKDSNLEEYICDIEEQKCSITNLLSQSYDGFDDGQKKNESIWWLRWDSVKNNLYGYSVDNGIGGILAYICDIQGKKCNKTDQIISSKNGSEQVLVPDNIFSPSLEKVVISRQHAKTDTETENSLELLLYATNNLETPLKTLDISVIIDQDENIEHTGVRSVAWSGDEKRLAIGTTRRIFMLDITSGAISLAYVAPADEEGDFYWDENSLFLSSDAKFITFVDEVDEIDDLEDVDDVIAETVETDEVAETTEVAETDRPSINVLKRIDLENSNEISELLRGPGLSFE